MEKRENFDWTGMRVISHVPGRSIKVQSNRVEPLRELCRRIDEARKAGKARRVKTVLCRNYGTLVIEALD